MSQWFYADDNRERHGPLPAENIVELFRSGRIAADTLVWREGAGEWQALRNFAAELGLDEAAPAPVATAMPPVPPPMQAPAATGAHATQAPKRKLSGCAITAIIGAAALVVAIPILAILAAIALPAYQEYVLRSKTATAHGQLLPLQAEIAAFAQDHGRCPTNDDEGFGSPEALAAGEIASVDIGRFDNGHCGLEARLHVPGRNALDGKTIWLDYDSDSDEWQCSSEVADKFLPHACRSH